ncbi:hypothetical protein SLA2020_442010 [Shorea laevis]
MNKQVTFIQQKRITTNQNHSKQTAKKQSLGDSNSQTNQKRENETPSFYKAKPAEKLAKQVVGEVPGLTKEEILPSLLKFSLPHDSGSNFPDDLLHDLILCFGMALVLDFISSTPDIINCGAKDKAA